LPAASQPRWDACRRLQKTDSQELRERRRVGLIAGKKQQVATKDMLDATSSSPSGYKRGINHQAPAQQHSKPPAARRLTSPVRQALCRPNFLKTPRELRSRRLTESLAAGLDVGLPGQGERREKQALAPVSEKRRTGQHRDWQRHQAPAPCWPITLQGKAPQLWAPAQRAPSSLESSLLRFNRPTHALAGLLSA